MNKSTRESIAVICSFIIIAISLLKWSFFTTYINSAVFLFGFIIVAAVVNMIVFNILPKPKSKKRKSKNSTNNKSNTTSRKANLSKEYLLNADIDTMKGIEFEQLCYMYFEDKGFKPEETPKTGDHGVDLTIEDPKDGMQIAVQCKRYKSNIGNSDLIKLEGGKRAYKCPATLFITTSNYTVKAKEYADAVHMEIWNGLHVHNKIGKWQRKQLDK